MGGKVLFTWGAEQRSWTTTFCRFGSLWTSFASRRSERGVRHGTRWRWHRSCNIGLAVCRFPLLEVASVVSRQHVELEGSPKMRLVGSIMLQRHVEGARG